MTEKIIALVDGSIYSESVCEHASWISGRTGAPVELIHVLGRREAAEKQDLSGSIRLGARSALLEELAELDAQRAKLVTHRGRAILEDARAIVRAARRPVFVASRAFEPIETVLVAYDGGRSAMKAVDHIARSPLFAGLAITIVTVGSETADVKKGLSDAQALLKAAGIQAETRIIPGQPETELGKLVDQERFGMVVMGAYGHSRIRSLVIGSTTTEMVRSCKVPVVLLR